MRVRKIIKARAKDFLIECEMENGEIYEYDMSFVLEETGIMIEPLRDKDFLKKVFIELGCITWPNGYCIDGDSVAIDGKLVKALQSEPA